jgi:hypothetical protein
MFNVARHLYTHGGTIHHSKNVTDIDFVNVDMVEISIVIGFLHGFGKGFPGKLLVNWSLFPEMRE